MSLGLVHETIACGERRETRERGVYRTAPERHQPGHERDAKAKSTSPEQHLAGPVGREVLKQPYQPQREPDDSKPGGDLPDQVGRATPPSGANV